MNKRFACVLVGALLATGVGLPALAADPAPAPAPGVPLISQADLLTRIDRKDPELLVLDVRTPAEFAAGHVPGAKNLSHDQLATRLDELASMRDKQIVLYCRSGRRTLLAADTLRKAGFTKLLHLQGDYMAWEATQRPVERPEAGAETR
jgi:phage shock protein E